MKILLCPSAAIRTVVSGAAPLVRGRGQGGQQLLPYVLIRDAIVGPLGLRAAPAPDALQVVLSPVAGLPLPSCCRQRDACLQRLPPPLFSSGTSAWPWARRPPSPTCPSCVDSKSEEEPI